jgi:hypothetical protein
MLGDQSGDPSGRLHRGEVADPVEDDEGAGLYSGGDAPQRLRRSGHVRAARNGQHGPVDSG